MQAEQPPLFIWYARRCFTAAPRALTSGGIRACAVADSGADERRRCLRCATLPQRTRCRSRFATADSDAGAVILNTAGVKAGAARSSSCTMVVERSIRPTSSLRVRWAHAPALGPGIFATSSSLVAGRLDCQPRCTPSRRIAHGAHRTDCHGRSGRNQLDDSQLPRLPAWDQRRRAGGPCLRPSHPVRDRDDLRPRGSGSARRRRPADRATHRRHRRPRTGGRDRHRSVIPHTRNSVPRRVQRRRRLLRSREFRGGRPRWQTCSWLAAATPPANRYLAKFASRVTILVRGESLAQSMSAYLITEIGATANIDLMCRVEVVEAGHGQLQTIDVRRPPSGAVDTLAHTRSSSHRCRAVHPMASVRRRARRLGLRDDRTIGSNPGRLPFESTIPGVCHR